MLPNPNDWEVRRLDDKEVQNLYVSSFGVHVLDGDFGRFLDIQGEFKTEFRDLLHTLLKHCWSHEQDIKRISYDGKHLNLYDEGDMVGQLTF